MKRTSWLTLIQQFRAIAIIRTDQLEQGQQMAQAVASGGIKLIEITWNSDRAAEQISRLRTNLPDCWIGAGTLFSPAQLREAIAAGAQFLFTPHVSPALIRASIEEDIPIVAGALSPTEIVSAWEAGATSIKVFPVQALGGVEYVRNLQGPLRDIPLIPTGGITLENARSYLTAGAIAVGLSGDLFPKTAIASRNWEVISQRAEALVRQLQTGQKCVETEQNVREF